MSPSPSMKTSKVVDSAEGLLISMSNTTALRNVVIISIFF